MLSHTPKGDPGAALDPHLVHHIIPHCWFKHAGHVEALAAPRDAERVTYTEIAPGTTAGDWHRTFQFTEAPA